jgi:hypothetical protein
MHSHDTLLSSSPPPPPPLSLSLTTHPPPVPAAPRSPPWPRPSWPAPPPPPSACGTASRLPWARARWATRATSAAGPRLRELFFYFSDLFSSHALPLFLSPPLSPSPSLPSKKNTHTAVTPAGARATPPKLKAPPPSSPTRRGCPSRTCLALTPRRRPAWPRPSGPTSPLRPTTRPASRRVKPSRPRARRGRPSTRAAGRRGPPPRGGRTSPSTRFRAI